MHLNLEEVGLIVMMIYEYECAYLMSYKVL